MEQLKLVGDLDGLRTDINLYAEYVVRLRDVMWHQALVATLPPEHMQKVLEWVNTHRDD